MSQHSDDSEACDLCGRLVPKRLITLHHLTPRSRGGKAEHRVPLCKPCHKQVHAIFDNRTLERELAQIETLRQHPALQPFLQWIRKQSPDRDFRTVAARTGRASGRRRR